MRCDNGKRIKFDFTKKPLTSSQGLVEEKFIFWVFRYDL